MPNPIDENALIEKLSGRKKPTKAQKKKAKEEDSKLLATARERAREATSYWSDNHKEAEDDLKFVAGEQWPSQVKTERELEQRPCLTNNVLPTYIGQVVGDQRQNRPAIKVSPVEAVTIPKPMPDGTREQVADQETLKISNKAGSKDYELGEVFTGLIKNIEYNCEAESSYDDAFEAAVTSGFSFLRVRSDYEGLEGGFQQELLIENIENQFAVLMAPGSKKPDYRDMPWCLIDDEMLKEDFKEKYPDAVADPVNEAAVQDMGGWFSDNTVRVSEYFTTEPIIRTQALMSDGSLYWVDEIEPIVDELLEKGVGIVRTRKTKTHEVYWRKITGVNVLEGPVKIPGATRIPVFPVFGKKIVIKKKVIYQSFIRHSKDAQRMINYWDSGATEAVALAPKAPFIGDELHFEGYDDQWKKANTSNLSHLKFVSQFQGDPGPRREQPAAVPAAEITLGQSANEKVKSTLGMYDASVGAPSSETSGRAIIAKQRKSDTGTYVFFDNLVKAITQVGKCLVEMAPKVMDTEHVARLKFPDETEDFVTLNEQIFDDETQEWVTINDLGVIKYDVVVRTGPAYATQRMEAAESMIQFAQAVPQAAAVMADLIAQNMDWPGSEAIAERLKKIIPPHVLSKAEQEKLAEDMPEPQGPNPEQQVQMAEFEARGKEAEAKMLDSQADVAISNEKLAQEQLKTEQAKVKLLEIEAKAAGGSVSHEDVRQMIAQALAEISMAAQQAQGA